MIEMQNEHTLYIRLFFFFTMYTLVLLLLFLHNLYVSLRYRQDTANVVAGSSHLIFELAALAAIYKLMQKNYLDGEEEIEATFGMLA